MRIRGDGGTTYVSKPIHLGFKDLKTSFNHEYIDALVKAGADLNLKNNLGQTILH